LALTARVLAIPMKRCQRPLLGCLSLTEMQPILRRPPRIRCSGQRDRILFQLMCQTPARAYPIIAAAQSARYSIPAHCARLSSGQRAQATNRAVVEVHRRLFERLAGPKSGPAQDPLLHHHSKASGSPARMKKSLPLPPSGKPPFSAPRSKTKKSLRIGIRHTTALHLLQAGNDSTVIALWLVMKAPHHPSYLELGLAHKERCPQKKPGRPPKTEAAFASKP